MAEKTSRWPAIVPDKSTDAPLDVDGISFDCSADEMHAAEARDKKGRAEQREQHQCDHRSSCQAREIKVFSLCS